MENKMFAKPMYKCAICDKVFEDVVSRATYELECAKRVEEEAKKAAEAKKREEKKIRLAEIDAAYAAADKLMEMYIKDFDLLAELNIKDGRVFPDLLTWILEM